MIDFLKRLFCKPKPETPPWAWRCFGCDEQGVGDEDQVRSESTRHLIQTGHTVTGGQR